ncbi:hypothetical protein BY458DRAFT_492777 [Sporodiniella umbellata]|nr:hypothetical protein BY458DRAFT_492777 [Sporodiniella umbellata]
MSLEDVTVSLSRLALAKAIKSSEGGEDAWSKSIIFHQSHITPHMRNSILHPQQRPVPKQRIYPSKTTQVLSHQPHPPQQSRSTVRSKPQSIASSFSSSQQQGVGTKNKRCPVPSDDESEVESEEEEDEESDDPKQAQSAFSRPSALKTTSLSLPAIETGHFDFPELKTKSPTRSSIPNTDDPLSKIEKQQREEDEELYARRMSTLRQLEINSVGEKETISWRTTPTQDTTSTISSSVSEDLIEEPILRIAPNDARSMSELDMYHSYFQQQQQLAYTLQMQQQMIQMAHHQQYYYHQQMAQQLAHYQHQYMQANTKARRRQSVSGMDLMIQKEQEKLGRLGQPKKKNYPNPSKASLEEGLMGKINAQRQPHTLNVQHQQAYKRSSRQPRPPSTMIYHEDPARHHPIPTLSLSTPQPYLHPPSRPRRQSHFSATHK